MGESSQPNGTVIGARLLRAYPRPRQSDSKVSRHVVEAFCARMEVAHNGINYLREEEIKTRSALESPRYALYRRGMARFRGLPRMTPPVLSRKLRDQLRNFFGEGNFG